MSQGVRRRPRRFVIEDSTAPLNCNTHIHCLELHTDLSPYLAKQTKATLRQSVIVQGCQGCRCPPCHRGSEGRLGKVRVTEYHLHEHGIPLLSQSFGSHTVLGDSPPCHRGSEGELGGALQLRNLMNLFSSL